MRLLLVMVMVVGISVLAGIPRYNSGKQEYEEVGRSEKVATLATDMIVKFEGFREESYKDGKRYSIGFGTQSTYGETISRKEASRRLTKYLEENVLEYTKVVVAQSPFYFTPSGEAALASLIYNVGWRSFSKSRCYSKLKKGDYSFISEWLDFNRAGGKFSPGLYKRRKEEIRLL